MLVKAQLRYGGGGGDIRVKRNGYSPGSDLEGNRS